MILVAIYVTQFYHVDIKYAAPAYQIVIKRYKSEMTDSKSQTTKITDFLTTEHFYFFVIDSQRRQSVSVVISRQILNTGGGASVSGICLTNNKSSLVLVVVYT